jgi:hypothetical protein
MQETRKVRVRLTEQQLVLLEPLREEGTFGNTMEEVMINVFREYARTVLGRREG